MAQFVTCTSCKIEHYTNEEYSLDFDFVCGACQALDEELQVLEFPVYNVMQREPEAWDKTRRMVVVDFQRQIFENHGLDKSYVLRDHSPYLCDKWSD